MYPLNNQAQLQRVHNASKNNRVNIVQDVLRCVILSIQVQIASFCVTVKIALSVMNCPMRAERKLFKILPTKTHLPLDSYGNSIKSASV